MFLNVIIYFLKDVWKSFVVNTYIPEEKMGVRLEDDVVIRDKGEHFNLMRHIPIEAEEIEELMQA